jgi:hypothetical protein
MTRSRTDSPARESDTNTAITIVRPFGSLMMPTSFVAGVKPS